MAQGQEAVITSPSAISTLYLDAFYFIYGLALIVLGSIVYAIARRGGNRNQGLERTLPFLAGFAIFHGLHEWLGHLTPNTDSPFSLSAATNVALMIVSFFMLFEFGRRLIHLSLKQTQPKSNYLLSGRIYIPLSASLLVGGLSSTPPIDGFALWSAYLVGFSGALLTTVGLLLCRRQYQGFFSPLNADLYLSTAAVTALLYGLLEGLVFPTTQWLGLDPLSKPMLFASALYSMATLSLITAVIRLVRLISTESHYQRRAIQQQAQNHLDRSGIMLIALNRHGDIIWVNQSTCHTLGHSETSLLGQNWFQTCLPPEQRSRVKQRFNAMMNGEIDALPTEAEATVITRQKKRINISWNTSLLTGPNGAIYGTLCSGQETEEKKRAELQLHLARKVFDNMPEGVLVTDTEATILSVNPAFEAATGYTPQQAIGQHVRMLKSGHHDQEFYQALWAQLLSEGQWQGEIWNRRKNGEIYPEWLTISALKNDHGETTHYAGIFSDINTQQHVQQRLQRLAYYDTLTGLPNRTYFYDHLGQELHRAKHDGTIFGVMFLDFDRFKNINDTLGHSVGDAVLKNIAVRLKDNVRDSDTVARLGGDEFVVLLPEMKEARHAIMVADKLMSSFIEPVSVDGRDLFVTASVGISIYPFDGDNAEMLIKNADTAMYHSKELGRNRYHFYTADMSARFREQLDLENGFRRALENNELYLVYQPQVDVRSGKIIGIEALARWHHPDFGDVPPSRFIALAEDSGMIGRMGEWVLRTACYQAKQWAALCDHPFRIAINISAHQLLQHGLCETVKQLIEEIDLDPTYLELELTESVLMENADVTIATLQRLSDMGIELSIDDFGTGYSSLSYLKRFAIDKLKIDRSFVKDVPHDANDAAIAATVIAMARNLNLEVIAEGVETDEQCNFLKERGCYIMQGRFFSTPVKAIDITHMLVNNRAEPIAQQPATV